VFIAALPLVTLARQKMRGAAAKAQMIELVHVDPEGPEADSLEELEQQEEM
jgi:hypothetical protein